MENQKPQRCELWGLKQKGLMGEISGNILNIIASKNSSKIQESLVVILVTSEA